MNSARTFLSGGCSNKNIEIKVIFAAVVFRLYQPVKGKSIQAYEKTKD